MTTTGTAVKVSLATLLVLAAAGCGSDTSGSGDGGNGQGSDGFDVSTATLTDQPFCDTVDLETVATVLGVSNSDVNVLINRQVGDTYEGPNDEGPPKTSEANLCSFGTSTNQFVVSVQPDATAKDVQNTVDDLSSLSGKGSSETCKPGDASPYGDPAGAFTCTSNPPLQRVRVVATGLVGTSKFYCSAIVNEGAPSDFAGTAFDACRSTLESLAD